MRHTLFYIFSLYLLTACSEYTRVVKSDDYERKYQLANELFANKSYVKAVNLYEQVYQRNPKNIQGETSYFNLAESNFNLGDFLMASYYYSTFPEKFPDSKKCEDASFKNLICLIKDTPKYSLDQAETNVSLNEIQIFIYKFPKSLKIDSCNIMMDQLRARLELKDFEAVKLYDKTESYLSAVTTAETFIKDFPSSKYKEKTCEILIRNSFLLAINSVEEKKSERIAKTIERYNNFVIEFPSSEFNQQLSEKITKLKEIL
jgi:outer membrane protein assembly factor BamD